MKTTAACLAAVAGALFLVVGARWLPVAVEPFFVVFGGLVALGAALFALAGVIVVVRYRRSALGAQDLFLELNRSREPAALGRATPRLSRARRWLARHLLGHDFLVGDKVEVKPWSEIRATLDKDGCLEQLPFMPEMLGMCGQRAQVFRCMHRLFDYRKSRLMRHMDGVVLLVGTACDGSKHGGCQAACHTVWKSAWLRRVEGNEAPGRSRANFEGSDAAEDTAGLQFGTRAPRYRCQLTQLHSASQPLGRWDLASFFRPLVSGNVAPAAFAVGWLTYLFNELQHLRRGTAFPALEAPNQVRQASEGGQLEVGEEVIVKSSAEIRDTLNDQLMHRGLWLEPDMLKYCGRRCRIKSEVKTIIDIVTGEMLTMKTPAYLLEGVHFSGERQLFNAQCEPLYWRGVWLRPIRD